MNFNFLAHVKQETESGKWHEHFLEEHLKEVASLASEFAQNFNAAEWAYLAGLWHDLGKYSNDFQEKIYRSSKYKPELKLDCSRPKDSQHAIAGAIYFVQKFEKCLLSCSLEQKEKFDFVKHLISHAIAGHHGGLPDWQEENSLSNLSERLQNKELLKKALTNSNRIPAEILNRELPKSIPYQQKQNISLLIRMIFSCLVDADFLDTEKFFEPEKTKQRKHNFKLSDLARSFNEYLNKFSEPQKEIDKLRCEVLEICRQKAKEQAGQIFSLTVPTGGGKTLSSMAFALQYALQFGKKRIIYIIPYTSIIEQNAKVFKKAFGNEKAVLEHHSNFDFWEKDSNEQEESNYEQSEYTAKLATENWDYPVIVTTTVQFFESLFANKPSKCRKLHNIADSVVVIDEVQLLPINYLNPILAYIEELSAKYNVTFLLSTATQPIFESFNNYKGLNNVQEIIPPVLQKELFEKLEKRIKLYLPQNLDSKPEDFNQLAKEIIEHNESVLCIVNTKKAAQDLYQLIKNQVSGNEYLLFHLSTFMCSAHRLEKLKQIKQLLKDKTQKIIVISTQLVEAGVDLDFPIVYRAMAGLASIAQAGGRCNREFRLEEGKLFVFQMPQKYDMKFDKSLKRAEENGKLILRNHQEQALNFRRFPEFFKNWFYDEGKNLDSNEIIELNKNFSFKTAAEKFKIIDQNTYPIVVPYGERGQELIKEIQNLQKPDFRLLRKVQAYTVSVYENVFCKLKQEKVIEDKFEQIFYIPSAALGANISYSDELGLNIAGNYEAVFFID